MTQLAATRKTFADRGKRLEYFTITWNSLEGLVAVVAGAVAGSISLVGFGIDSFIEVTSGATLLWRMSVDADEEGRERNERLSIRIVGLCFLALAVYVAYEGLSDLMAKKAPEHSIPGIVLAWRIAGCHADSVSRKEDGEQRTQQRGHEGRCKAD